MSGNVRALIELGKLYLGQSENTEKEGKEYDTEK